MKRLAELVLRYRLLVVAGVALVSAFFASGLGRVRVESDVVKYLRQDLPEVRLLDYIGRTYGGTQLALVALEAKDVFSPEVLGVIRDLTRAYHELPGVSAVTSLTNILDMREAEGGIEVTKLVDEYNLPQDPEASRRLRDYALSKELYRGKVVSGDGRFALMVVKLREDANKPELARKIRRITQDKLGDVQGTRAHYGGVPLQMEEVERTVVGDMRRLVPVVAVVVVVVLFLGFRSFRGVVLPLAVVGIAVLWSVGLMAWTGVPLSIISNAMPVLLIAIGTAYSIHLLARYGEEGRSGPPDRALVEASEGVGRPVLLAGATTMAGFLSFSGSYLSPLTHFGIFTAFGVGVAMLLTLTFVPALLSLLPPRAQAVPFRKGQVLIARALESLERSVLGHTKAVLSIGVLVLVWAAWSLPHIVTQVNITQYFPPESELRRSSEVMRENFGGDQPVMMLVRGDMKDPFVLKEMYRTSKFLRTVPGVHNPQSLADLLAEMNYVMNRRRTVPDMREKVANLLFMLEGEEVLSQLVKDDRTEGLIQARSSGQDTRAILRQREAIDGYLATLPEGLIVVCRDSLSPPLRARVDSFLVLRTVQEVVWDAKFRGEDLEVSSGELADVLSAFLRSPWRPSDATLRKLADDYEVYLSKEAEVEVPPEAVPSLVRKLLRLVGEGRFPEEQVASLFPDEDPEALESTVATLKGMAYERFREDRVEGMMGRLLRFLKSPNDPEFAEDLRGDLWGMLSQRIAVPGGLLPEDEGRKVSFEFLHSGTLKVYSRLHDNLIKSQVRSLVLAFLFVAGVVSAQLGSVLAGILATSPFLFVLGLDFGLMGTFGIPLDFATVIIASTALGIGIDYTIHFLSRFGQELGTSEDLEGALRRTIRTTGRAILLNATTVGLGFSVLALARLGPLRTAGLMVALTMGTSALAAVALLPAIILVGGRSFLKHRR